MYNIIYIYIYIQPCTLDGWTFWPIPNKFAGSHRLWHQDQASDRETPKSACKVRGIECKFVNIGYIYIYGYIYGYITWGYIGFRLCNFNLFAFRQFALLAPRQRAEHTELPPWWMAGKPRKHKSRPWRKLDSLERAFASASKIFHSLAHRLKQATNWIWPFKLQQNTQP